jgi:hypothetical protein
MAKKTTPLAAPAGSVLPKVIGTLVLLALLLVIVKHPSEAAVWAKALGAGIGTAANGLAAFLNAITG